MFDKEMPAFAALFSQKSSEEIGSACILSRATAGIAWYIFGFFNWIALIVEVATLCGAVYTTMDYYNSKRRNFQKLEESTDSDEIESYQEPIRSETNDVKSKESAVYCPFCGNKISGDKEYCPSCGDKL